MNGPLVARHEVVCREDDAGERVHAYGPQFGAVGGADRHRPGEAQRAVGGRLVDQGGLAGGVRRSLWRGPCFAGFVAERHRADRYRDGRAQMRGRERRRRARGERWSGRARALRQACLEARADGVNLAAGQHGGRSHAAPHFDACMALREVDVRRAGRPVEVAVRGVQIVEVRRLKRVARGDRLKVRASRLDGCRLLGGSGYGQRNGEQGESGVAEAHGKASWWVDKKSPAAA